MTDSRFFQVEYRETLLNGMTCHVVAMRDDGKPCHECTWGDRLCDEHRTAWAALVKLTKQANDRGPRRGGNPSEISARSAPRDAEFTALHGGGMAIVHIAQRYRTSPPIVRAGLKRHADRVEMARNEALRPARRAD